MKLYLLSQNDNNDYDTWDAVVVCAESQEAARLIHPSGHAKNITKWKDGSWANSPDTVDVQYLGEADPSIEAGVVLSSFNAG